MQWTDKVVDDRAVKAVFGDEAPSLANVELVELKLDERGPTLRIRLNLPEFPSNPPEKWVARGDNAVQLTVSAVSLKHLSVQGGLADLVASVELSGEAENRRLTIVGDQISVECLAGWLYVDKVSAYHDLRRIPKPEALDH